MLGIEKFKLWLAALIVVATIYLASYEIAPGQTAARLGVISLGLLLSVLLVVFSQPGRDFYHFSRDAGIELRKVVWPQKQETVQLTGMVFLIVTAITLFLWGVDFILNSLLKVIAV